MSGSTAPDPMSILTAQLASFTIRSSRQSTPLPSSPETNHITLPLLEPLSNPALLALCRNSAKRFESNYRGLDGAPVTEVHEYLDLTALRTGWRKIFKEFDLSASLGPLKIDFDISIPSEEVPGTLRPGMGSASVHYKLVWDGSGRRELVIVAQQVANLALLLAIEARMRVGKEREIEFRVGAKGENRKRTRSMKGLRMRLDSLEKGSVAKRSAESIGKESVVEEDAESMMKEGVVKGDVEHAEHAEKRRRDDEVV